MPRCPCWLRLEMAQQGRQSAPKLDRHFDVEGFLILQKGKRLALARLAVVQRIACSSWSCSLVSCKCSSRVFFAPQSFPSCLARTIAYSVVKMTSERLILHLPLHPIIRVVWEWSYPLFPKQNSELSCLHHFCQPRSQICTLLCHR